MTRILITGGEGFIGHQIVKALIPYDLEIEILVRQLDGRQVKFSSDDSISYREIPNVFKLSKEDWVEYLKGVDVVIHCAWYVSPTDYLTSKLNLECLSGSLVLAHACVQADVGVFVGLGTCYEYDDSNDVYYEDSPLSPKSLYAQCKASLFSECNKLFESQKTEFLWCRIFFLYGEYEKEGRLVTYIDERIRCGEDIYLKSPDAIRDFMNVESAGKLIVTDLLEGKRGVTNICSESPQSVAELTRTRILNSNSRSKVYASIQENKEETHEPNIVMGKREKQFKKGK